MRLILPVLTVCLLFALSGYAPASVVLTGTRVIYPEALPGKTLQLSNDDAHPWLVQMWLDAGNEESTPETPDDTTPFALSPPIFRIEPNSGQAVRLMFTGEPATLPVDREFLFYLNFTQIPALQPEHLDANRLMIRLRNRVKVFYRPRALAQPDLREMACALRLRIDGDRVQVENPAAFHAVVSLAELVLDDRSLPVLRGEVLPPFSRQEWPLDEAITPPATARLRVSLVNDYGADERHDCPWR